jgi:hypothetical protein
LLACPKFSTNAGMLNARRHSLFEAGGFQFNASTIPYFSGGKGQSAFPAPGASVSMLLFLSPEALGAC